MFFFKSFILPLLLYRSTIIHFFKLFYFRKGKPLYPALSIDTDEVCLVNFGGKDGTSFEFDPNLVQVWEQSLLSMAVEDEDEEDDEEDDEDGEGNEESEEEEEESDVDSDNEPGEDEERRLQMGPDFRF